jgi:hypothetical protein
MKISPIADLTLGGAFQSSSPGDGTSCNDGLNPAARLALGGRAQFPFVSVFAVASAWTTFFFRDCGSSGPGVTPLPGWTVGFLLGAALDLLVNG